MIINADELTCEFTDKLQTGTRESKNEQNCYSSDMYIYIFSQDGKECIS